MCSRKCSRFFWFRHDPFPHATASDWSIWKFHLTERLNGLPGAACNPVSEAFHMSMHSANRQRCCGKQLGKWLLQTGVDSMRVRYSNRAPSSSQGVAGAEIIRNRRGIRWRTLWLGILAGVLASGPVAYAQSWEQPFVIDGQTYSSTLDSCSFPRQFLLFEGVYPYDDPTVVYRAIMLRMGAPTLPPPRPWHVKLTQFSPEKLAIWVCRSKSRNWVNQCVDYQETNGTYTFAAVTIPDVTGVYYVIVTGALYASNGWDCGSYWLDAFR
jgi:hypothetical protein